MTAGVRVGNQEEEEPESGLGRLPGLDDAVVGVGGAGLARVHLGVLQLLRGLVEVRADDVRPPLLVLAVLVRAAVLLHLPGEVQLGLGSNLMRRVEVRLDFFSFLVQVLL